MAYSLSPTALSLFKECRLCFWLQHNKNIKRPEGIFPSLPAGMDRILKEHFDSYIGKDVLPPELEKHGVDAKLFCDKALLEKWRNYKKGLIWQDDKGNILRGAIDTLLMKEGKIIVLDYKTRGYECKEDTHEHYRHQLDIYNLLLRKMGYDTEEYSYLLFYHPDKVVDKVFLFHSHLVRLPVSISDASRIMDDAIALLDGPMPKKDGNCEYCRYRETRIAQTLLDY